MQPTLAGELAWKLHDAAALLKIAMAANDAEMVREAQQRAVAVVEEVQQRSGEGGIEPREAVRLQPLLQLLKTLMFASANPQLVGTVVPFDPSAMAVVMPAAA